MKNASPALVDFLASNRQFACADLFTIIQRNGNTLRFTTADVQITSGGFSFNPYAAQVSGLRYRVVMGLETDEQTMTIAVDRSNANFLGGVPMLDAIQKGALDGARIKRERCYLDGFNNAAVGSIVLFSGIVASVERVVRTHAELKVKSDLYLLDVQMPRNKYQAACLNTLYDSQCTVDKVANTFAGVVGAGSTKQVVNWSGATAGVFWQGTITFITGQNAGHTRTIKNSTGTSFELHYPLMFTPAPGDTFAASYGCDKTMATCGTRFTNIDNFRGFPFIPPSEMAW